MCRNPGLMLVLCWALFSPSYHVSKPWTNASFMLGPIWPSESCVLVTTHYHLVAYLGWKIYLRDTILKNKQIKTVIHQCIIRHVYFIQFSDGKICNTIIYCGVNICDVAFFRPLKIYCSSHILNGSPLTILINQFIRLTYGQILWLY